MEKVGGLHHPRIAAVGYQEAHQCRPEALLRFNATGSASKTVVSEKVVNPLMKEELLQRRNCRSMEVGYSDQGRGRRAFCLRRKNVSTGPIRGVSTAKLHEARCFLVCTVYGDVDMLIMSTIVCVRTRVAIASRIGRAARFSRTRRAPVFLFQEPESRGAIQADENSQAQHGGGKSTCSTVGLGLATKERPIPIIPYCSIYRYVITYGVMYGLMYARSSPYGPNDLLDNDQGVRRTEYGVRSTYQRPITLPIQTSLGGGIAAPPRSKLST
uniref:Uncharacterized protein n=1 Tax=Coccidioides posadasii RMSCC 3488 TaxID=454284 RepID=A0A0J6IEX3_COCPO|nr:hypothetical protein CPAG_06624 [Coccidioides posadasii RMSCC 3488]